jgi:hypothetical protein
MITPTRYRLPEGYTISVSATSGLCFVQQVEVETIYKVVDASNPVIFGPYPNERTFIVEVSNAVTVTIDRAASEGFGHATYADGAAEVVGDAVAIAADTRTLLTIDGLGAQTETRWKGTLPANVWTGNVHNIEAIGQAFGVLVEFSVQKTAVSTDALLQFTMDIGSDPLDTESIVIFQRDHLLTKAQDTEQHISQFWDGYGKETFLANGARYYVECNEAIELWGAEIYIVDRGVPSAA